MSDNGNDSTQQNPQGDNPKYNPDKIFSNGYNDGLEKGQQRALKAINEATGNSFDSLDRVAEWTKDASKKLAESISDPTQTNEYKELQKQLSDYKQKVELKDKEVSSIKNQYKFDSTFSSTLSQIKKDAELKIGDDDVKALFGSQYQVEFTDNGERVMKGGQPVMTDDGSYKPLSAVLNEFTKKYATTISQGTGGGSGSGGALKPKYADFKAATQAKNSQLQGKLFNQAKEAGGWAEPDAPII